MNLSISFWDIISIELLINSSSQSHHFISNNASICSGVNLYLIILAGLPPTIAYGGIFPVTYDSAATIAPSPIVTTHNSTLSDDQTIDSGVLAGPVTITGTQTITGNLVII